MAKDMDGKDLEIGSDVRAWEDGKEYTAKVKGFEMFHGPIKRVVVTRDDDQTERKTFSDAVKLFKRTADDD